MLTIWPVQRPAPAVRSALETEGARLLAFMAPNAGAAEIDVKDVDEWLPEL
jgi:hypothetical protein